MLVYTSEAKSHDTIKGGYYRYHSTLSCCTPFAPKEMREEGSSTLFAFGFEVTQAQERRWSRRKQELMANNIPVSVTVSLYIYHLPKKYILQKEGQEGNLHITI